MSDPLIVKSPEQARQGKTGLHVRVVLIVGLILVIAAFALIYAFGR